MHTSSATGHATSAAEVVGDETWQIRRTAADFDRLGETESIFALGNGWVGWRGVLDEGAPCGMPGSYVNGFHERRELSYPEEGYAFPQASDTVVSAPNAALIRLWVDDEPLDLRTGTLRRHDRVLDLRAGVLRRQTEWISPGGRRVLVRSTRLVSLPRRPVAAVRYEVEPLDAPVELRVCSDLLANERVPESSDDPRAASVLTDPLTGEAYHADGLDGVLVHRTERSGQRVAVAVSHLLDAPETVTVSGDGTADRVRVTVAGRLHPGERLRLTKFAAYECTPVDGTPVDSWPTWSSPRRTRPARTASTLCSPTSAPPSTRPGRSPTCSSTAIRNSSRRSGSRCST